MKYLIDHVLEGSVADRARRAKEATEALEEAQQVLAEKVERRDELPGLIGSGLREYALHVEREGTPSLRDMELEVKRLYNLGPSAYDIGQQRLKVKQLAERAEDLNLEGDSSLEQFLKALKDGGETHVSQYGLKQAGFDVKVAPLIVARSVRVARG